MSPTRIRSTSAGLFDSLTLTVEQYTARPPTIASPSLADRWLGRTFTGWDHRYDLFSIQRERVAGRKQ